LVKNKHEILLTIVISWERKYFRKTLWKHLPKLGFPPAECLL